MCLQRWKTCYGFLCRVIQKFFLTEGVHIEPDFYSKEEKIVGEIFAHHGKTKGGQNHKVAQDILKML